MYFTLFFSSLILFLNPSHSIFTFLSYRFQKAGIHTFQTIVDCVQHNASRLIAFAYVTAVHAHCAVLEYNDWNFHTSHILMAHTPHLLWADSETPTFQAIRIEQGSHRICRAYALFGIFYSDLTQTNAIWLRLYSDIWSKNGEWSLWWWYDISQNLKVYFMRKHENEK